MLKNQLFHPDLFLLQVRHLDPDGVLAGDGGDHADGVGLAIEDVAAGMHVYRKAKERNVGREVDF